MFIGSCSLCSMRLIGKLQSADHDLFGRPVATVRCAAVERGLFVVQRDTRVAIEVPVRHEARGRSLGDGHRGIGISREGVVVDVELAVTQAEFEGAPAFFVWFFLAGGFFVLVCGVFVGFFFFFFFFFFFVCLFCCCCVVFVVLCCLVVFCVFVFVVVVFC